MGLSCVAATLFPVASEFIPWLFCRDWEQQRTICHITALVVK